MTPEEEAAAIEEAQVLKTGRVYKPDVKRKGAVIIPAHLYKAPKTILTPEYNGAQLEALAAKASSFKGDTEGGSTRRSSRRNASEMDEPHLDLETMKKIKRLRLQKEGEARREKEGSAASSASSDHREKNRK